MLDVDHINQPKVWFDRFAERVKTANAERPSFGLKDFLLENGIYLIAITASGHGLRVIGKREQGESIEAAQMRMAQVLGIKEYDAVTKDLARASYVVPREYVLWIDEDGMFSDLTFGAPDKEERPAFDAGTIDKVQLALPAHVEGNSADAKGEMPSAGEEMRYRGIPYADIVQQLMLAMGAAGGAEIGERNTVYFSLANYMRYICDFNAGLLLRVLPDFGLSEQERKQAISSAIGRPRKSRIPTIVQGAVAICERDSALSHRAGNELNKATDLALPELPRLLKLICRRLPEDYRAAMIIASLPVICYCYKVL